METLDLGDNDDDTKPIQRTQASQMHQADDLMEIEVSTLVDIMNERLLIVEDKMVLLSKIDLFHYSSLEHLI